MSRPLLELVRERLACRLEEAREMLLLGHLGVWLGVIENPISWVPPDGLRQYLDVAEAGAVVAATDDSSAQEFFEDGIEWLKKRRFFIPGQPGGLEADPVALWGLAVGFNAIGIDQATRSWLADIVQKALSIENDPKRSDLLALVQALIDDDPSRWRSLSPLLQTALANKSKVMPTQEQRQLALKAILNVDPVEPEWAIVQAAALNVLFAMEAEIDLTYPTVEQVVKLLRQVPAALKRWPWEDKPKTQHKEVTAQRWDIQHEYHVQSLLWTVLRPVFPSIEDEENLPSLGHKHPRADLLVPGLRLVIEVKYLREATQSARAKIIEEIAADSGLYLSEDSEYDCMIVFIWDATGSTHHHDELVAGIRKLRGIVDVIVVSRPGQWTNEVR